ncbi:MAG: hypothetical protein FJY07_14395, partial [Bacteroidetes bacterium]|nr:hypothetical protein [Bacteroidota bacterium]
PPDYDKERVYVSDMKKVVSWYNTLLEHKLLDFTKEEEKKEETESAITSKEQDTEVKPVPEKVKKPAKKAPTVKGEGAQVKKAKTKKEKDE